MSTRSTNEGRPSSRPNGVDVALAVARQRIADAHHTQVLAFIDFTAEELAAPQAMSIYARLHQLTEDECRALKNRVLATFGTGSDTPETPAPATFVAINGDVEWDITASLFRRLRRRLGGRRNLRLRRRVELFSGRVDAALLEIHVDSVCRLLKSFEAGTSVSEVARLYMEELDVRRPLYHAIYIATLHRLYGEMMAAETSAPVTSSEPASTPEARPLKMVQRSVRKSG